MKILRKTSIFSVYSQLNKVTYAQQLYCSKKLHIKLRIAVVQITLHVCLKL